MKQVEVSWLDCGCVASRTVPVLDTPTYRRGGVLEADSVVWGMEAVHALFCPFNLKRSKVKRGVLTMSTATCTHCGRTCGDEEGGWGSLNGEALCHPNVAGRPDCYRLVTVFHHPLGHEDCPVTDGVEGASKTVLGPEPTELDLQDIADGQ